MIAIIAAIFCIAYILGLLLTGIPGQVSGIPVGAIGILLLGIPLAFLIRRVWRMAPRTEVWLAAALIGVAAMLHFQIRLPQPAANDICHSVWAEPATISPTRLGQVNCQPSLFAQAGVKLFQVEGKITSPPRLTRSNRLKFELAATQVSRSFDQNAGNLNSPQNSPQAQPTTGKVYVTVPQSAGEQLYPGMTVQIAGSLYKPKPAANPGGFDFEKYLAQQGIFTGLNGRTLTYPSGEQPDPPLFWSIRQRIQQVQAAGLGQPAGALVSAMVMGKGAVDVPYEIQDQFKQTGLAHALAASGAQVSLLIGVILALTQRLAGKVRLGLGTAILILYIGLTGIEASVLRAGVMGFVALLALTADRQVKPVGSLLFAATLLLLVNPLWVWDLGFQLSFLATLGLLVTVPILTKWLDWMPNLLTPMFAVPIAAYLWTLPLLLFVFGIISPYSILVNVIVSPLITLISIGGMISATGALVYPAVGSLLAALLYYPTHLLLKIAEVGSQLPGNTFAVGTINAAQVLLLYGFIGLIWRWHRSHKYWWIAGLMGISFVAVPVGYTSANVSQITVLATAAEPVLVVQDSGKVGLIHSGDAKDVQFSVLPFLHKQGINHLDWAIAPNLKPTTIEGWQQILAAEPIDIFYSNVDQLAESPMGTKPESYANPKHTYLTLLAQIKATSGVAVPLSAKQKIQQGAATLTWMQSADLTLKALQLQMGNQTWLLLSQLPDWKTQSNLTQVLPPASVVGWSGQALSFELLKHLNPKLAIMFDPSSNTQTEDWLKQQRVQIHAMTQDGALLWSAQKGFTGLRSLEDA